MDHPDNPPSVNSSESDKSDSETSVLTEEAQSSDESAQEQATPDLPPAPPPSAGKTTDGEPPDDEGGDLGAKMTFLEHLGELRKRILHSSAAVAIAFCLCWVFREKIFEILAVPIADVVAPGEDVVRGMKELIFIKPTEPFSIWLKVSFVAAIFLAAPYLMVQVWLFIAPGLYRKEKAYAVPFLLSSTVLFLLGGIFAYYIILPTALDFLINQFGRRFTAMVSAIEYFNFEVIILVGMGLIFQLPVLVAFLSLFGLVTPRFLWRNFRYAFLLIVIVAAVVSPTADVLNLFLWSGPMVLLYLISIGISWIFKRRREKRGVRAPMQ
ncbi:twin-arginine translocase subunit TatC [Acidobacteria bacterium AH-259-O06]|nr:twin-arginine translocase subunit TatC [Acidobacteria bacterium AH-259-O06]